MPNKRRAGLASIILRLPAAEKQRLTNLVARLNELRPEAAYTVHSIIRAGLLDRMEKLEAELPPEQTTEPEGDR